MSHYTNANDLSGTRADVFEKGYSAGKIAGMEAMKRQAEVLAETSSRPVVVNCSVDMISLVRSLKAEIKANAKDLAAFSPSEPTCGINFIRLLVAGMENRRLTYKGLIQ